ncbi:hypothetical protein [Bacillus cereus]|uniref:hypothetical protein n=1 Tax=Bacillus cereus TaxID=1396 RepID=UPI0005CEDAFA|nr:hypothetical protein [Bacillus cereus]
MVDIRGYAINLRSSTADHTYVKSSDGCTWPCFGRSEGGCEICVGSADSKVCNELAEPDSHADITYGITGVCHQAANRILLPTCKTVKEAGGYFASTFVYGVYGTDAQEFFVKHQIQPCTASTDSTKESEFIKNVQKIYTPLNMRINNNNSHIDLLDQEFVLFLEYKLDNNVNNTLSVKLKEIHTNFHKRKIELINNLHNQKISPRDYANQLNKELSATLDKFAKELTVTEFKKLFNLMPDEHVILVDPEIIVLEHK